MSSPREKALLPRQTVVLDTATSMPEPEKVFTGGTVDNGWRLVMQKLPSVSLATGVSGFILP